MPNVRPTPAQHLVLAFSSKYRAHTPCDCRRPTGPVPEVAATRGETGPEAGRIGRRGQAEATGQGIQGRPVAITGIKGLAQGAGSIMKSAVQLENTRAVTIGFQEASIDIWDKKYRLKSKSGDVVDETMDDTYQRVARALADVEAEGDRERWFEQFLWALRRGAIPAGRIISNAGAREHKPATSTINCTVSGTIGDSMQDILTKVHEAGLTLKAGCGIGYEFSTLRPKGAYVSGAGAHTSGPMSFMDIYDKMCFTVSSAGGRRGAQMGTFDVGHPDVLDFIRAKREDGRLRQFNLSLLVTDEFMQSVKHNRDWALAFPLDAREVEQLGLDLDDRDQVLWREWPTANGYVTNDKGQVACRIYKKLPARRLWDMIMASTYDFAEPGFVLVDRVNEMNNNWFDETIRATNPCGEQPLPPYGSCLLGSINLTKFVLEPFADTARFDWDEFHRVVKVFTRMLDNVVEINGLPLQRQRDEILRKRRHGMGFLGLGSTLTMLRMRYGSKESVKFTEDVSREMALAGWETALDLAREKGPAPILLEEFTVTGEMLRKRPEMAAGRLEGRRPHPRPRPARPLQPLHAAGGRGGARAGQGPGARRRALHPSQLHRADRHHLPVAGQQRQQRHRAQLCPPVLPQRDPGRARSPRRRSRSCPSSCWPTASSSTRAPCRAARRPTNSCPSTS